MDSINELRIDPEFAEKIPPLTPEEYEQLEANILAEGAVLSPLIVWNGVIVDGHNRYKIIQQHPEIRYTTHEKEFSDRYEAIAWICKNQLGRRNLTPLQRKLLIGKQYEAEKAMRGGRRPNERGEHGRFTAKHQNDVLRSTGCTSHRIAEETKTSSAFVERAARLTRAVGAINETCPGIEQEIMAGKLKPPDNAIISIARASPEDRPQMVEELRKPRPSPKRKKPTEPPPQEESCVPKEEDSEQDTSEDEEDTFTADTPPVSALSISERMASTPERVNRDSPVDFIITELTDALDGMIFRWDFCLSDNKTTASSEECCRQIRELAAKGITYLKSYQGRKKKK